jgi:hypothetical protein
LVAQRLALAVVYRRSSSKVYNGDIARFSD